MQNLYSTPQLYDIFYNKNNEEPLRNHYKGVFENKSVKTIFDCSIGTGNLTFALCDLGFALSGSDISLEMLEQARVKSESRNIEIQLFQSDFRNVHELITKQYDCVMSTGNSLPHVSNSDVKKALKSMSTLVKQSGYLYLDTRNWDKIIHKKERFFLYNPLVQGEQRTNVVLVKDFIDDEKIRFNFLYSFEKGNKIFKKEERIVEYYPIKKDLLICTLKELGFDEFELFNFTNHKIIDFNDMDWYSIICKKVI
jgi:2-polyprenyl-3-methyl-5-hydroxy-6-metoxy-1,4-benzoquinol methylase